MKRLSFLACILSCHRFPSCIEAFSQHFLPPTKGLFQRLTTESSLLRQSKRNEESRLQETDKAFWLQQKQLIQDLSDVSNKGIRARQKEQFSKRQIALVGDTALLSFFVFCGLWSVFDNPFISLSYLLGATSGLAYAYGLGEYFGSTRRREPTLFRINRCKRIDIANTLMMRTLRRQVRRKHRRKCVRCRGREGSGCRRS
jgi:hypothetical protein